MTRLCVKNSVRCDAVEIGSARARYSLSVIVIGVIATAAGAAAISGGAATTSERTDRLETSKSFVAAFETLSKWGPIHLVQIGPR